VARYVAQMVENCWAPQSLRLAEWTCRGVPGLWTTPLLSTPTGPFGFSIVLSFFYYTIHMA
jgi:hypothetical protein